MLGVKFNSLEDGGVKVLQYNAGRANIDQRQAQLQYIAFLMNADCIRLKSQRL